MALPAAPSRTAPPDAPARAGWDVAAALTLLALAALALLTFPDYGVTWDEPRHQRYGELVLGYYRSLGADRAFLDYFDLYLYGPAFDLLVAALQQVLPMATYGARHLVTAGVGLLGIAATWRLARRLAGPRAGFLALVLLAAAPDWYGHLYHNPKDVPFAAAMAWALLALVRLASALPRPRLGAALGLGLAAGVAMAIRVPGGVLLAYAGALLALWTVAEARAGAGWRAAWGGAGRGALTLVGAGMLAAAVMLALWPWAQLDPVGNTLAALRTFSDFPFDTALLYAGQVVHSTDLPWHYVPVMLLVRLPEPVLVGLAIAPLLALRPGQPARATWLGWTAVALAGLVPVAHVLVTDPTLHNGLRHLLFIVPPLTVIAAGALDRAWAALPGRWGQAALELALAGWLGAQAHQLARLHPYEYIQYNGLAGGVRGASGRFELDYWGASVKATSEALVGAVTAREGPGVTGQRLRVVVCGPTDSVRPYLPEAWEAVDAREVASGDLFVAVPKIPCEAARRGEVLAYTEREGVRLSSAGRQPQAAAAP
jgi:4-amino-4-deoxy-L-arabinose transferase-like glycosyltransferase